MDARRVGQHTQRATALQIIQPDSAVTAEIPDRKQASTVALENVSPSPGLQHLLDYQALCGVWQGYCQ